MKYLNTETGEMLPLIWKTPHNHDTNAESDRTALTCEDKSLTKQEFVRETDINVILERYKQTNTLPPMAMPEDFTDISGGRTTYFEIQSRLAEARGMFYTLDPKLRYEFQNDPTRWADAVVQANDNNNRARLRYLGIDAPEPLQEPPTPEGGTPAPSPAEGAPKGPEKAPSGAKD